MIDLSKFAAGMYIKLQISNDCPVSLAAAEGHNIPWYGRISSIDWGRIYYQKFKNGRFNGSYVIYDTDDGVYETIEVLDVDEVQFLLLVS